MILIHTALFCEAQALIEYYKLKPIIKKQVYKNENIVLVILGIGKENTLQLESSFSIYSIEKAFNIGIAGCNDTSISIGSFHSSTHDISKIALKTVNFPQNNSDEGELTMYDMEGEYFLNICKKFLTEKDIYIFKVISDHLDDTILPKDTIKNMIHKNIKIIDEYIR
jgi:nucleoside phosphorylase